MILGFYSDHYLFYYQHKLLFYCKITFVQNVVQVDGKPQGRIQMQIFVEFILKTVGAGVSARCLIPLIYSVASGSERRNGPPATDHWTLPDTKNFTIKPYPYF